MRGKRYNLQFKIPQDFIDKERQPLIFESLLMEEVIDKVKECLQQYYSIKDMRVSNQMIYNLYKREDERRKANAILRFFCRVEDCC